MTDRLTQALEETLATRSDRGLLRSLVHDSSKVENPDLVDFSSNDYLGFARSEELDEMVEAAMAEKRKNKRRTLGAGGSRLLTGDSIEAQELERYLAEFHDAEAALLFNSGFDANLSVMAALPQPGSVVLFDELVHNSCREGIRMCRAKATKQFKHNDVEDLRSCLKEFRATNEMVIVVIESVYSMDGHIAPLKEMLDVTDEYGAYMVVDEAHGTGVYGKGGRGLTQHLNEQHRVYARVHTFGKAVGAHGAVVVGPKVMRSYLINYARPLIYSTSLPMHSLVTIKCAYELMERTADAKQERLSHIIDLFQSLAVQRGLEIAESPSPIQAVIIRGNERVVRCSRAINAAGYQVFPIRAPTVPAGEERIRIVLHSYNSDRDVQGLIGAITDALAASSSFTEPADKKVRL